MAFRVGQKVACVDVSDGAIMLQLNAIYTVAYVHERRGRFGLSLVEASPNQDGQDFWDGFRAERFRPLVERKTDISVFTAMLTPSLEDMRELIREGA